MSLFRSCCMSQFKPSTVVLSCLGVYGLTLLSVEWVCDVWLIPFAVPGHPPLERQLSYDFKLVS